MEKQKRRKYFEINIPFTAYELRLPRVIKVPVLLYVFLILYLFIQVILVLRRVCS